MADLIFRTATELAGMIRAKKVSSAEIVEAHLHHIERFNPPINALVTLNGTSARNRAKEADAALSRGEVWGPLHGVPVTFKDVFETAGLRTTSSFKPLAGYIPQTDATPVARLKDAGAIILGKTNMPMLALDIQSDSPLFGRANNPWDIRRTPGGSTGGGAAAVAAGLTPLEIGSDIGGSVRIPAHYCGIFSLKTTEHRVSLAGHIPEPPDAPRGVRHMGTVGPLARSIGDLRLALSLIAGDDGRCWEIPPVPVQPVPKKPLNEYRIAWTDDFGIPVTADTRSVLEKAVQMLAKAGCRVERQSPTDLDFKACGRRWAEILGAEIGAGMTAIPRLLTRLQFKLMPDASIFKKAMLTGLRLNMPRYAKALTARDGLIGILEHFLSRWDAWLCPVSATPAFTHRKMGKSISVDGVKAPYTAATMGYTAVFSLTGNPVVILPAGKSKEGLPIGIQVVGRRWQDMELLAVAEAITEAIGPFQPPPGFSGFLAGMNQ